MTTYLNNVTVIYFIHNNYVLLHHFDLVFWGHFFLCSIDNGLRTFPGHCFALSKKKTHQNFFSTKQKYRSPIMQILSSWSFDMFKMDFIFNVHFNSECLLNQVTAVITSIHYKKKNSSVKNKFFFLRHPIVCYDHPF